MKLSFLKNLIGPFAFLVTLLVLSSCSDSESVAPEQVKTSGSSLTMSVAGKTYSFEESQMITYYYPSSDVILTLAFEGSVPADPFCDCHKAQITLTNASKLSKTSPNLADIQIDFVPVINGNDIYVSHLSGYDSFGEFFYSNEGTTAISFSESEISTQKYKGAMSGKLIDFYHSDVPNVPYSATFTLDGFEVINESQAK